MKAFQVISTTALFLFLGATLPAFAQEEHHEEAAKPAKQQEQAKPAKQEEQKQAKGQQEQEQKQQEQAKSSRQEEQKQAKGQQEQQQKQQGQNEQHAARQSEQEQHRQEGEQRAAWTDHRAHNWKSEHRDWKERGGYNGYRIPEDRYRGYFGAEHAFRIYTYPVVIVGGDPRFQYGGFWFSAVDPWPEYWSANWYDNDDVYITYADDGYYLYNRRYPQDRIAVSVYVN
jgi:flagellar motor protein MotB